MKNIIKFLKSPDNSESSNIGYKELFEIFKKKSLKFQLSDCEEYFHEFILKHIVNNSRLQDVIAKSEENEVFLYITKMMENFLINCFRVKSFENSMLSLNTKIDPDQDDDQEFLDFVKDDNLEKVILIESIEILNLINKKFSEDKKRLLCEMIYREKRGEFTFIKDISESAFYKRVERFKVEIRNFFKDIQASDEGVRYFLYNIYPSEICEKFRLNYEDNS